MEMNVEKFKQFGVALTRILKGLETENLALRATILALLKAFNAEGEDTEHLVIAARNAPSVQKMMDDKYDPVLAEFLSKVDKETLLSEKFFEFLRSWKPSDPQN